jgi:two-component system CheB/CheR fusion protein
MPLKRTNGCKVGIEMNRDKNENAYRIVNLEVTPITIEGEEPLLVVVFGSTSFRN